MNNSKGLTTDFLWYFLGMSVPMFVLFLRSPIYTRIFSPEMYGQFALVNVTFFYISSFTFNWLYNSAGRFYHRYSKRKQLKAFNATIGNFLLLVVMVFVVISIIWGGAINDVLYKKLIFWGALHFIFQDMLATLLVPMRYEKKAAEANIYKALSAIVSFVLLLLLTFIWELKIEAFYIATSLVNGLLILILVLRRKVKISISYNRQSLLDIKRFFRFGVADWSLTIGVMLILSSDRFLIELFYDTAKVGIYNQMYNLAYTGLTAFVILFQTSTNPYVYEHFEKKPKDYKHFLPKYVLLAFAIYFPLTIFGVLFSKEICKVLLGENFREAWTAMPFVFGSVFIYGLCHFYILPLKMVRKYKVLAFGGLVAGGVNIILNIILLPRYGYLIAGLTTFIAYAVLLIIYYFNFDFKIRDHSEYVLKYAAITSLVGVAVVVHFVIKKFIDPTGFVFWLIAETSIFAVFYLLLAFKLFKGVKIK